MSWYILPQNKMIATQDIQSIFFNWNIYFFTEFLPNIISWGVINC